ncbi:MAG: ATP-dependent DNA ligase, partial [Rhodococcus sp. (in: high G+C Gram-positive bacteria)]
GAWRRGQGGRSSGIGSVLLGIPEDGGLRYVGRVGTGFTERDLEALAAELKPLESDSNPFADEVPAADRKGAVWVTPTLVGEVRFREWTGSGRLRHPSWRGLREDKSPDEVTLESL